MSAVWKVGGMSLFKSENKKLDPRVKYQSKAFTSKLQDASRYKRVQRPVSENAFLRMLAKIKFTGWLIISAIVIVVCTAVYMLYISTFFEVSSLVVQGGTEVQNRRTIDNLNKFLSTRGTLGVPQKNLLMLSKAKLASSLLGEDVELRKGFEVSKEYPRTLRLTVDFRKEVFWVGTVKGVYAYFDDGGFEKKLSDTPTKFFDESPSGIVKIWWQGESSDTPPSMPIETFGLVSRVKKSYFPPSQNSVDFYLAGSGQGSQPEANTSIDPRVLQARDDITSSEIVVYTKWDGNPPASLPGGFKIYLDSGSDIEEILARTEVLVGKRSPASQKQLFYIDMRFPNRAFLCDQGAACSLPEAQKIPVPPGSEVSENLQSIPPSQQTKPRGQ